ncbi:MAG: hypothetical protein COY39_01010 [Alphaproteobacteria bacterium CG_4_10_14_0_8_um_filter_37_21]|nr:MAG: hypothetical protein COY39_01010 [Alphaproteobacteria bacterium CG_4_10_14_0_8_um_filter_37_21]
MLSTIPDFLPATAEIFILFSILLLMLIGVCKLDKSIDILDYLAPCLTLCTLIVVFLLPQNNIYTFSGSYINDQLAFVSKIFLLLANVIVLILSKSVHKHENLKIFEIPVLILFATLGMMMMISSSDIIIAFISLELTSLSLYILTAIDRNYKPASEAGIKYFTYGAISTAFFLFGLSFLYGITGSTHFDHIANDLSSILVNKEDTTLAIIGIIFITISFMFKLAAAPFHYWLPDVYQGTKLTITTLIATTPKFAIFVLYVRFLTQVLPAFSYIWKPLVLTFAILSLFFGTLGALQQKNIKRFLAYSGTMNIGFVLLGVAQFTTTGIAAAGFYMFMYLLTLIGIFASLMYMKKKGFNIQTFDDLTGMSEQYPLLSFSFCIGIISLAGLPPLPGFIAKAYVLYSLLLEEHYLIAIVAVLTTVIATAYYLNLLKSLMIDALQTVYRQPARQTGYTIKLIIMSLISLVLIIIFTPNVWMKIATKTAIDLLH